MRRLLVIPALVLGLAAGNALGSTQKVTEAGTVGKISALSSASIGVDGKHHDLTCRVGEHSPDVTGFAVGDRVAIVCRDHRLRKLVRLPDAATATGTVRVLGTHVIHVDGDGDHDRTCRITDASPDVDEVDVGDKVSIACADGVLVKVAHASAAPEAKTGSGAITALGNGSITIKGERTLTCALTGDSPVPGAFKVGDQVGIACVDGVLVKIVRLPQPAGSNDGSGKDGTTTTTPTVSLYATGSITALTDGAISVHGDRDTTCTRGPSSPKLGDFKVGDKVRIACTNGVLAGIARTDSSPPPPAPPTTTPTANTYATGSITAITDGAIAIHGDRDTTCTRGPSSPTLGDYKVGDKVTIACVNGVLSGIAKSSSPPPPPPPPPPPAPTANDYTTGSIVAITDGAISVHGDRDTTCTRGASSPKLGDYKVGDRVTIGCAGGVLAGIVRTS